MTELTRRHIVGGTASLAGAAALGILSALPATAASTRPSALPDTTRWTGTRSANGWPVLKKAAAYDIEGSGRSVHLAAGDTATLLLYIARRFHYEVDQLREGDVRGHHTSPARAAEYESNLLSGTATSGVKARRRARREGARGDPPRAGQAAHSVVYRVRAESGPARRQGALESAHDLPMGEGPATALR